MNKRICRKCNTEYDLNKSNFGHAPGGTFIWTCRICKRKVVAKHSAENPDLVSDRAYRRKETIKAQNIANAYDAESLKWRIHGQQERKCYYCKQDLNIRHAELDHMTPIVKGGLDKPDNLVVSCHQCNREKHNKTVEEYRTWRKKVGETILF